jgi:iron complex outermembrane recepter protein
MNSFIPVRGLLHVLMRRLGPAFLCLFTCALATSMEGAEATGVLTGSVSNASTRNLLEGAVVEVPRLGIVTLTDSTGRFTLNDLPPGTHEVTATYTGLDPIKTTVTIAAGQRATQNFDLTSGVYKLDAFQVTGEREGNALALTAQRNAPNVKNVVAIDAYGNLPNMNASELAVLLPGVAGNVNDEGNLNGFTIRGMGPGMNTILIDGALMGSQGGDSRQTRIHTITGSMFDQLELVKGHTPDKGMDSLGGTINLKSRSPLSMKERRRTTYNFSARWAPPGTQQIPMREDHRLHPILNVAHQQVFDVLGGEKNLGVALNFFYSEQAVGYFSTTRDFQNTPDQPAYVWDYGTEDNYNNRKQTSVNGKFDFRLSPRTKISLNTIYNDAMERFRLRYNFRAFTGNQNQNTVPSATTAIVPGFTSRITEVRPTPQSIIDITSTGSQFYHRQRHFDLGAEHELDRFTIDYNATRSRDRINSGAGANGVLVNRVTGVGWILDRTQNDLYPRFIQTAGPDITNPASYRPNSYNFGDAWTHHEITQLQGNVRWKAPTEMQLFLKTGARWREELVAKESKNRRLNFTGTNSAQLPTDPTIRTFGNHKTGLNTPQWKESAIAWGRQPVNPALWSEDRYFHEAAKFSGHNSVTETVSAGYLMAQGKFKKTGFLGGVRVEETEDESFAYVQARVPSSAALRASDPVAAARQDFANTQRRLSGSYTKSFPSAHLTHDFTRNLRARASWSTSFGRPPLSNLVPVETPNDTNRTLTISNPNLRPQTSENWDAALEYYFEPVGSLSVTYFDKKIEDYFVAGIASGTVSNGADNGFGGEYGGYTILTRSNLGTAKVNGWEFSYYQQFTFLPGLLKGLSATLNYTVIDAKGNFGGTVQRSTGNVAGFIPRTGNAIFNWQYRKFSFRTVTNYTSDWLRTFTAVGSGQNLYTRKRVTTNVGASYQFRPWLTFNVDSQNVFGAIQSWYRGNPDQLAQVYIPGPTVTFSVSGRF